MALAVATKASATDGTAGDVTVTKPSSLAIGDLMVAAITSNTTGAGGETHSGPSGWTKLQEEVPTNGTILTVWGIIATSTETAASNFSWTSAGTNSLTAGAILRVTATGGFTSLGDNVDSTDGNTSAYPTFSSAGLTTTRDDALLLMVAASESVSGNDVSFASYAVANSNPTWTEEYDVDAGTTGARVALALASAPYATAGATGNFSFDADFDGGDMSGALVSIIENVSVTVNPSVVDVTATINAPTVTGSANVSPTAIDVTAEVQAPTVTATAQGDDGVFSNASKSDTSPTWLNPDKS